MKLLLTSGGISTPAISAALFELVGKEPDVTSQAGIASISWNG